MTLPPFLLRVLRRAAPALAVLAFAFSPVDANAQRICAKDLNGNGDATDPGESAQCVAVGPAYQCPIERVACTLAGSVWSCPTGPHPCLGSSTSKSCSPNVCINTSSPPVSVVPPIDDPGAPADGGVTPSGECAVNIEIFGGRGMRCRPPGALNTFSNCCKDNGKIIRDGGGSSITSLSSKVAVAKHVFTGMSAAYTAFAGGATASSAASSGFSAMVVGIDPTSIAVSLAVSFIASQLLQGCDQQDSETGMMKGSEMCHEVGSYCDASIPVVGCIQRARSFCCFNSKLGRIIQEQGRPQLTSFNGIGWGPVRKPICRGLTPEEFQALDFSKMDLSEYYAEVESRAQATIETNMQDRINEYMSNVVG